MENADVKEAVRLHWDHRAATFDERPNHGIQSALQHEAWLLVLRRLTGTTRLHALDVGCGTGFLALLLAELGHHVTGVDFAPEMLVLAERKAVDAGLAVTWRLGDVETLPDADGTYDLLIARHLIWTLPDPAHAVREWQRVLRQGGRIVLIEGHHWERPRILTGYESIHTRLPFFGGVPGEQLAEFMRAEGLKDVMVQPLMDAALWGETPQRQRYMVTGQLGS